MPTSCTSGGRSGRGRRPPSTLAPGDEGPVKMARSVHRRPLRTLLRLWRGTQGGKCNPFSALPSAGRPGKSDQTCSHYRPAIRPNRSAGARGWLLRTFGTGPDGLCIRLPGGPSLTSYFFVAGATLYPPGVRGWRFWHRSHGLVFTPGGVLPPVLLNLHTRRASFCPPEARGWLLRACAGPPKMGRKVHILDSPGGKYLPSAGFFLRRLPTRRGSPAIHGHEDGS